ncbi:uncharacterized protein [Diabrotica undecimpunctata]|uniref:uncharacterized protein n=1 Tax=Diabrotica undecimpunctata TaxID=50387 RepID=UPI003B63A2F9
MSRNEESARGYQPIINVVNTGGPSSLAIYKQGDDFEVFEERLEQYFGANLIEESRRVAVLITLLSEEVYKVLRDLCNPEKPKEKDFETLMKLLSTHFKPRLSVYRRRIIFDLLRQGQESVNDWYLKIKNQAAQCDFGDKLLYRVQDKFVVGMRPGPILDRLCEESPSKSLQDFLEIALNKEAALREQGNKVEVNRFQQIKKVESRVERKENSEESEEKAEVKCNYCNKTNHTFSKCKYKQFTCKKCGKRGHIMAACKGKVEKNYLLENVEDSLELFSLDLEEINSIRPICVPALLDTVSTQMELDTGAGVSCLPYSFYKEKLGHVPLENTSLRLKTYSGEIVIPEGKISVNVKNELHKLEAEKVIEKISNSNWGTPLLPVMKANGNIRICGNYKITVNKYLKDFNHPLPRIDDIFVALQGGQKFTKLDFLNAYNQLVLDDNTSRLLSWSAPYGIYKVNRLPYGTKPACSIVQAIVKKVLQGCAGTVNFLDDVVVTGKNFDEHLKNLEEVLCRLDKAGFRLNSGKCEFFRDSISNLPG